MIWIGTASRAGRVAVTGSTFSPIAKTTISTIAGDELRDGRQRQAGHADARSTGRPRLSAATTPPKMLSGTTITKATAASLSERPMAGNRNVLTGSRNW